MTGQKDWTYGHVISPACGRLVELVGTCERVGKALGRSEAYIRSVWRSHKPEPEYIKALAELLELVPMKDWPERWRR